MVTTVAAFDLPLSRLFRGHHDPAGACERTDRSADWDLTALQSAFINMMRLHRFI